MWSGFWTSSKKAEETVEFKLTKPRETFSFKPSISIEGSSMIELTSLEAYNFIFNLTEESSKIELYTVSELKIGEHIYKTVRKTIK